MSGLNKVILIGNLGRDPEAKGGVTTFSMATSESWIDKESGEKQEKTEWHKIVCFKKTAELASQFLSKGRQVCIEGKLQTRSWEDQDGNKRYQTEVIATNLVFLGGEKQEKASAKGEPHNEGMANKGDDYPF